jgi:hypothetical protein
MLRYVDLQLIMDVVLGRGVVSGPQAPSGSPEVQVIFSNPDLLWANEHPQPRFGMVGLEKALVESFFVGGGLPGPEKEPEWLGFADPGWRGSTKASFVPSWSCNLAPACRGSPPSPLSLTAGELLGVPRGPPPPHHGQEPARAEALRQAESRALRPREGAAGGAGGGAGHEEGPQRARRSRDSRDSRAGDV